MFNSQQQPPELFCKKGTLRNFAEFIGKHLCQSLLFNKVTHCNFIKKETLAQCFLVNFVEFLRTPFLTEHLWWLLLKTKSILLFKNL